MTVHESAKGPPSGGSERISPQGGDKESADARGVPSAKARHAASRGAAMRRRGPAPAAAGEAGRGGRGDC